MKRLMPDTLIHFLQTQKNVEKADLFAIHLPNGEVILATEGQWDVTVPSGTPGWSGGTTTFKAREFGVWSRGDITSEASTKVNSNTMSLTCTTRPGLAFPGLDIGLNSAAFNHLFDGAQVFVYTAYWSSHQYGDVSVGIETKWMGYILNCLDPRRSQVGFECADPGFLLNQKVPSRLFSAHCAWAFCDDNCTLAAADFTVSLTAALASTQNNIVPAFAMTQPDGYFVQGVIKCITGANAGLSQSVRASTSSKITTVMPWLLPVEAGDTFTAIKGCDKTLGTCKAQLKASGSTVDNSINFSGTPFTPPPTTAV